MPTYTLPLTTTFPVYLKIDAPPPGEISKLNEYPFTVTLSTQDLSLHTIHLFAQNSQSRPYQVPRDKWSHLIPQWRFLAPEVSAVFGNKQLESDYVITSITPTSTSLIYDLTGGVLGQIASAQFYYVDDLPSTVCNPILLWATADFSEYSVELDETNCGNEYTGYANSKVLSVTPYVVQGLNPSRLSITRNRFNDDGDMYSYYWKDTKIPYIITVEGQRVTVCPYATAPEEYVTIFNIPTSNDLGVQMGEINRELTGLSLNVSCWSPSADVYLSAYDSQDIPTGGFLWDIVTSPVTTLNTVITAGVSAIYQPVIYYNPYLWVSNPENNTINSITIPCITDTTWNLISTYMIAQNQGNITYYVDYLQLTSANIMGLTGFHGIFGIAVDPCNHVWFTDSESDKVYRFDTQGNLVSTIDFNILLSATVPMSSYSITPLSTDGVGITPAGISLDSNLNPWVTFFDSACVVKLDYNTGNIIASIDMSNIGASADEPYYWDSISYDYGIDPAFKPVLAETDFNDGILVTYTHPRYSTLVKYDSAGVPLLSSTLYGMSCPMDIHFDSTGNYVWITLTHHSLSSDTSPYPGNVVKLNYNTLATVVTLTAQHPEYLALDFYDNVWFTDSLNTVKKYDSNGNYITSFNIGVSGPDWSYFELNGIDVQYYNALEGICCDSTNRIFVINSIENKIYSINDTGVQYPVIVSPALQLSWYNNTGTITVSSNEWNKSAQAFGDWSGMKWVRKYTNFVDLSTRTVYITGQSSPFAIKDYTNYSIRRFNESWDAAYDIQQSIPMTHIRNNPYLWDAKQGVFGGAIGDAESEEGRNFGRRAFERIQNFVQNQSDIDTCNIAQLYNLSRSTDVPIDNYNLDYPPELRRLMDIFSINQQVLWGSRCKCNKNFKNLYETQIIDGVSSTIDRFCDICGHFHAGNRGELFNPATYVVTAFYPFIVKDKYFSGEYWYITPPLSTYNVSLTSSCLNYTISTNSVSTYPLSSHYRWLFTDYNTSLTANSAEFQLLSDRYCFYDVVNVGCQEQIAGIINWDDQYTTLAESESSLSAWYGASEKIEQILNYELHRGLGLLQND